MVHLHHGAHERLLRRPAQEEDRLSPPAGRDQQRGRPYVRSGRSSVKRYAKLAEQGRPLTPKKRSGSKPKMDESARRLLDADMEERPAATLAERREFLRHVAGIPRYREPTRPDSLVIHRQLLSWSADER
jgi:hypothetical protein